MLRKKNLKAQSNLEYILILSAVVGVIIYAAANWIKTGVSNGLTNAQTAIGKAADKL